MKNHYGNQTFKRSPYFPKNKFIHSNHPKNNLDFGAFEHRVTNEDSITFQRMSTFLIGVFSLAFLCLTQISSGQTNNYFGTAGTLSGSVWSTAVGGPYTSALVTTGGPILNFNNAGTATGATIATIVGMNFNAAITWTAGGTLGAAGINLPISVAAGITQSLGTQAISGSATAAFTKNGDRGRRGSYNSSLPQWTSHFGKTFISSLP